MIRLLQLLINGYVFNNKKPTNRLHRQNAAPQKFDPKPSEAVFSAVVFSNFNKRWPEVADVAAE